MLYEDLMAQQEAEEQSRIEGSKNINRFLGRLIGDQDPADPSTFARSFEAMNYDQFLSTLGTLNGILKQIPKSDRQILGKRSQLIEGGDLDWITLKPVKTEIAKEMLKNTFETMQAQSKENDPGFNQRLAITLYNTIIYLHAFPDGNGRTARLLYFLLSPRIQKTKETFSDHLTQILTKRSKEINNYHHFQNYGTYQMLLDERGIPHDFDEENNEYCATLTSDIYGFDMWSLGYLAVIDTLTDEEKQKYGHPCQHGDVSQFTAEDFPADLWQKIELTHEQERQDFTENIIAMSESTSKWPDFLMDPLNKAFEYKKDDAN